MKLLRSAHILSILCLFLFSCSKKGELPTKTIPTTSAGTYLLFDADQDYNTGKTNSPSLFTSIYYTKPDGTGLTRLTTPPASYFDYNAKFSPDGKQVYFIRDDAGDDDRSLCRVDISGNNLSVITTGSDVADAAVSPDGKQIAYTKNFSSVTYANDVCVANPDGSDETNITKFSSQNGDAVNSQWSANGKIYFQGTSDNYAFGIYAINANGTGITSIIPGGYLLAISPDGLHLLYDNKDGIFICKADGSDKTTIISASSHPVQYLIGGAWGADGKEVFYAGTDVSTNVSGIFRVNADGTGFTKILTGYYEYPSIF
jgi:dipeptidyl aminopeptidase/acylaminoacyl peptidase